MNKKNLEMESRKAAFAQRDILLDRLTASCRVLSSLVEMFERSALPQAQSEVLHVYWAGCGGLARLASDLPDSDGFRRSRAAETIRVDKIGSTSLALEDRLALLGKDEYAAWSCDAWGELRKSKGFCGWMAQAIHTTRGSLDEAVTVRTRSIDVLLPRGLSRRAFDKRLQDELAAWSLVRRFPDFRRFSAYDVGSGSAPLGSTMAEGARISEAKELYAGLDPRQDGDRLLAIVENLLRDFRCRGVAAKLHETGCQTRDDHHSLRYRRIRLDDASLSKEPPLAMRKPRASRSMSAAQIRAMHVRLKLEDKKRGLAKP